MIRFARRACLALLPMAALAQNAAHDTPAATLAHPAIVRAGSHPLATRHLHPEATRVGIRQPLASLPAGQDMPLSVLLSLRDPDGLKALLADIYDPRSPNYRHFLGVEQFTERFAPTQADYDAMVAHLRSQGLKVGPPTKNRLVVEASGPVASVEQAFHVRVGKYQHPTEARTYFAPDREPSIDAATPVWHVGGLDDFSRPHPLHMRKPTAELAAHPLVGTAPGGAYTGVDIRKAYFGKTPLTGAGQSVAVFTFNPYWDGDLQAYFRNTGFNNPVPVQNILLNGSQMCSSACDDGEQIIDIANIIGVAPGLSQVQVYIGHSAESIFNRMATDDTSKAISISWSWGPADPGSDDPIFLQMAAQGQSVFVASGDGGSYAGVGGPYPAEDPNITAVGGTDLSTNNGAWAGETGWSAGGGGYSSRAIPSWQVGVANGANQANTTQRNVPDVAAEGNFDNYLCGNGTCSGNIGGTSFAAPRWAGFIALVNQQAAAQGKPPVGFINPALYRTGSSYGNVFHDITSGSNGRFQATGGYDLVTGLGSPNGQAFIDYLAGTSWSRCADENGNCTPSGPHLIRYGAGDSYVSRYVDGGSIACSNQGFGVDPQPDVFKHCDLTPAWTACAGENGRCGFDGRKVVWYGAGDQAAYRTADGGVDCSNATLGDPAVGVVKQCYFSPEPAEANGWTSCAAEGDTCNFPGGTRTVGYGANGHWSYRSAAGSVACRNDAFGGDPLAGTAKACYYK